MHILDSYEVPVANAIIPLARDCKHPFTKYACYWIAFNNCYVTLFDHDDKNQTRLIYKDGQVDTAENGSLQIPKVAEFPSEKKQIENALCHFSVKLKSALIQSSHTGFFAERIPRWRAHGAIESDGLHQRLNGVLNVTRTVDAKYPVWSPIDRPAYTRFQKGDHSVEVIDLLSRQILELLYTVRNNTLHGSKCADDASDIDVAEHAAPLLEMILRSITKLDV